MLNCEYHSLLIKNKQKQVYEELLKDQKLLDFKLL